MRSSTPWALTSYIINLNAVFYTHVEDSPTRTIYIRHYMDTHTHTHTHCDCSKNWVFILVRAEILWEEEGFQFGFKRWQGWAVSKVLWEWIPNVGSKARESAKNTSCVCIAGFSACGCQNVLNKRCTLTTASVYNIYHFACNQAKESTVKWERALKDITVIYIYVICIFCRVHLQGRGAGRYMYNRATPHVSIQGLMGIKHYPKG